MLLFLPTLLTKMEEGSPFDVVIVEKPVDLIPLRLLSLFLTVTLIFGEDFNIHVFGIGYSWVALGFGNDGALR